MLGIYLEQLKSIDQVSRIQFNELPGLRTFTPSLAKYCGCTERTIQNHRKKLLNTGILATEEKHGGNGLRIWFSPQIILLLGPVMVLLVTC